MLTHEELMEKCQELQYAVDALLNAMLISNYIYDLTLEGHAYYMDNLTNGIDSLGAIYLENRDNISDEDTEEIIRTIVIASNVEGFAAGTMDIDPEVRMLDVKWNKLK